MRKNYFILLSCVVFTQLLNAQIESTFYGENAGTNSTGNFSTGFGVSALFYNTGNSNTGLGWNTLKFSQGGFNCAVGNDAMKLNETGRLNAAYGTRSLEKNISGSENIAVGHRSLGANIAGNRNTAIGYGSLSMTEGSDNISLGYYSPRSLLSGNSNIFIGNETGLNLITGNFNVFLGKVRLNNSFTTAKLAGNGINRTVIIADGAGMQKIFFSDKGNAGIGLGNNAIPLNRLDINGGVAIGRNFTPNASLNTDGFLAPANGMIVEGRVGIGSTEPKNKLEITHGTDGNSGLRFTNLTSNFLPTTTQTSDKFLTVNQFGDVVLQKMATSAQTTNVLSSSGNTMTSNVNGVSSNATIINSISNTINSNNQLITTVNGVSSAPIDLPFGEFVEIDNSTTNELQNLSISGNVLSISNGNSVTLPISTTSVVAGTNITVTGNGSSTTPYQISSIDTSLYANNGVINQATTVNNNRIVNLNNRNLWFDTSSSTTNGKLYIGSSPSYVNTTGNYKLFVEGGIMTEKVKVALRNTSNWADYVFEKDYQLLSLNEVEKFVQENKHLPGIPSAAELFENGIDVAEMQSKQMEKIEELTLYIIDQDKKLDKQAQEIELLKAQVQALLQKMN